jgi:hypothetical protein
MSTVLVDTVRRNSKGRAFALGFCEESHTFSVWACCENYSRGARGGIRRTWRYVEKGLDQDAALRLLDRRSSK